MPQFLGFFGGSRFVPIITSFVAIFVGVFFFIVWPPIQQALISAGEQIVGAQKIFFAQLADPNHVGLYTEGTRFFAGRFSTMIFGLPAAALYYFSFRFLITKFDIKTPGRGDEEAEETKVVTKSSIRDDVVVILEGPRRKRKHPRCRCLHHKTKGRRIQGRQRNPKKTRSNRSPRRARRSSSNLWSQGHLIQK